jgi:hypothetical protein
LPAVVVVDTISAIVVVVVVVHCCGSCSLCSIRASAMCLTLYMSFTAQNMMFTTD